MICRIGHENNPLGPQENSSSSHELPMRSRAKVEPGSGKHSIYTHFPKDPNCDICLKTKRTRPSCRRRAGTVVPKAENVGDLITADHKVLSEESESRNSHRHAVVVQDLATQWIQSYPCKTKTSQETQKSPMKFLEPTRKPKVICTDKSMEFGKTVILFVEMVEYHPISDKDISRSHQFGPKVLPGFFFGDQSRLHQFGSKVLPGIFLGYALHAGRIWKRDIMIADIEELEEMDVSELHARRLNAKGVLTPLEEINV